LPVRGGGPEFRLSEQRGGFVFLHFMRNDWCPVCQVMLRVFSKSDQLLAEHNIKLAVISPNAGPEAEAFAARMGLRYSVLIDPEHVIARRFGVFDPRGNDGKGSVLPVGFLIGPDGTLRHASHPNDVSNFLDPSKVLQLVEVG
jgi:peroxiredoxin